MIQIQFKFLSPQIDSISSNFSTDTRIEELEQFLVDTFLNLKYPKYQKEDIQILTTYPTRVLTYKEGYLTLKELNLDQKRIQLMVKVVKDLSKVEIVQILDKIPGEIICPISKKIFIYPVVTKCSHIYEKREIESWIKQNPICPNCDKAIYGKEDLKEAPKEFRDKILKYVEESTILNEEFKIKFKKKMEKIKIEKMNLIKIKGLSHKITKNLNSNYKEALNIWKENGMNFWMIETEKNQFTPFSIYITNEIFQLFKGQNKTIFMISGKLLNISFDIYIDINKNNSYHSETGETRKIVKSENTKEIPQYERSLNNSWILLSTYSSFIIYNGIQLGCDFVHDIDIESVYNLKQMKLLSGDKTSEIRKFLQENKDKLNQGKWQYQIINDWYNYDVANNKVIETVFNLKGKEANITKKDGKYKLIFKDMIEINIFTQEKRKIQYLGIF